MSQYYLSINIGKYIPYNIVKKVILMTFDKEYDYEKDEYVIDYFEGKDDLREDTVSSYKFSLKQFSLANKETIKNIIENCLKQQRQRVEADGGITEFNPNQPDSLVKKYIRNFEKYCEKNGNRNTSIMDKRDNIYVFLKHYDVKRPRKRKLEADKKKWNTLSKEDVRYILKDCNIVEQALITFMLSTGLRRWDVSELTIGDFMDATRKMEYHNFVEVNDFIDNAPDDMIGFWDLFPHKESKKNIHCKTFNSGESSNLILQNLRRIKNEYIPNKQRKDNIEIKLEKSDALFGSRMKYYKKSLTKEAMTNAIRAKNPRFKEWKIKQIDEKIENKEISKEDREKEIEEIPTINPHALRKIFTNAVDTYGGLSLRANLVMEGHKSPVPTDLNYVKKEKEELFKGYKRILPHLTILEEVQVKILSNDESEKLNMELENLKKEKKDLVKQIANLKEEKDSEIAKVKKEMEDRLTEVEHKVDNQLTHLDTNTPLDIDKKQPINSFIMEKSSNANPNKKLTNLEKKLMGLSRSEKIGLSHIAYSLVEYDIGFQDNEKYLSKIIKKALREWKRNPVLMEKAIAYQENFNDRTKKWQLVSLKIDKKLADDGFWEDDEMDEIHEKILNYLRNNQKEFEQNEITDEYIDELIDKFA